MSPDEMEMHIEELLEKLEKLSVRFDELERINTKLADMSMRIDNAMSEIGALWREVR